MSVTIHRARRTRVLAVVGLLSAVGLAACSSGGSSEGGDGQAKIILLAETAGESPLANDEFANGFTMAIDDINASGGINGQKVISDRIPSSPVDPQKAIQAIQKAAGQSPTVMLGMPASSMVRASLPQIARAGAPLIDISAGNLTADEISAGGGSLFQAYGSDTHGLLPENAAKYLVEDLGAKRIGLLYPDLDMGHRVTETLKKAVTEYGAEVVEERSYSATATDLTEQVLAMKKAKVDAVVNWGYPNQIAVQLQQFKQNGMSDIPTIGNQATSIVGNSGLVDAPLLKDLYGSQTCNPAGDSKEWAAKYEERFGRPPHPNDALTYDLVHFAKAAIEAADSTDPKKVAAALKEVTYSDGVCRPEYHSGEANVLSQGGVVVALAEGEGNEKTVFAGDN